MKTNPEISSGRFLWIAGLWVCLLFLWTPAVHAASPLIVDHNCTDIHQIPEDAIEQAKATLHIAYGHTSHGSQLIAGMGSGLDALMTAHGATPGLYLWSDGVSPGRLDLDDYFVDGDLGNPDRVTWAQRTRAYLDNPANSDVNVVIWSWCGQAAAGSEDIQTYLDLMEGLINDYPQVQFVFMTGHLNGTGPEGILNQANNQIRAHCLANDRILYDFADIESYDPDGLVNYMELNATDGCYYDSDGDGTLESNWALDWQGSHVEGYDWWASGAAHSQHLNGNLKGYAAWWLWASLAGWNQAVCQPQPTGLSAQLSLDPLQVSLQWTDTDADPDETGYIIQRRFNSGAWETEYALVASDVTSFVDTAIVPGLWEYRVVAYLDGDAPCLSRPSAIVSIQYADTKPQDPSNLEAGLSGSNIELTWQDNSDNEDRFEIERASDRGPFYLLASVSADVTTYVDENPAPLHTYSYRVKAVNSYDESDYSNAVLIYMPDTPHITILKQSVDGYTGCTDTYLDAEYPDAAYGNTQYKNIGGTPLKRMAIRFELPGGLLGKTIHEAKLIVYCWTVSNYQDGFSFSLHEISEAWDEDSATWLERETGADWSVPGGSFGTVPVVKVPVQSSAFYPEFDITGAVQAWSSQTSENHGLMLVNDSAVITGIKASEYSEYGRPALEITWSAGPSCQPDSDTDGDVDGRDLAAFVLNFSADCLEAFSADFGH